MARAFRCDRQSVELPRQADGEVADIDHLLDLTAAFVEDLAGFECHESGQFILVFAQRLTEATNQFAASWRGHRLPEGKGIHGPGDRGIGRGRRVGVNCRDHRAVDRRANFERRAIAAVEVDAERFEPLSSHLRALHTIDPASDGFRHITDRSRSSGTSPAGCLPVLRSLFAVTAAR